MYTKVLKVFTFAAVLGFLSACTNDQGASENYNTRDYGVMSKLAIENESESSMTSPINLDVKGTESLQSKLFNIGLANLKVLVLNDATVILEQPQFKPSIREVIGEETLVVFVSDKTAIKAMERILTRPTVDNSKDLHFILERAHSTEDVPIFQ
jgi:hypothetical protein